MGSFLLEIKFQLALQFDTEDLGPKLGFVNIEKVTKFGLLPPQGVVVMGKWVIYMPVL